MKNQESHERKIRFLVCKMLTWNEIEIEFANGLKQRLERPEGEPIIGFVPVYEDRGAAVAESQGLDIIALTVGPIGEFIKEEGEDLDAKTENS